MGDRSDSPKMQPHRCDHRPGAHAIRVTLHCVGVIRNCSKIALSPASPQAGCITATLRGERRMVLQIEGMTQQGLRPVERMDRQAKGRQYPPTPHMDAASTPLTCPAHPATCTLR